MALLIFGCAADAAWTKAGATEYEHSIDNRECSGQANSIQNPQSGQIQATYNGCMREKGWRLERR